MRHGLIHSGRWLLPGFALAIAMAGFPDGPVRDNDRAELYRGGADVPLPMAALPGPTVTPTAERDLLDVDAPTVADDMAPPAPTYPPANPAGTPEPAPATLPDNTRDRARQRAEATYSALWDNFYVPEGRLFREQSPNQHPFPYSYLWPLSQTLGVSNTMAGLPDANPQYLFDVLSVTGAIELYFDDERQPPAFSSYIPPPNGHENDRFYDDNAWIGLELMRAYEATGYQLALERAGQIFDYLVSGWDTDPTHPMPGGIFWVESARNRDRNTVSTAPAAQLGLLLAEQEQDPARKHELLTWSKRMYDWVDRNLRGPDGLYWDHVGEDGTIDASVYTYNQGAMLGATLLMYRATGDEQYLDRAGEIGQAVITRWDVEGLLAQPVAFNAILFRELLQLNDARPDARYLDLIVNYANRIWTDRRDSSTNLVTTSSPTNLLDQSAAARIYAMLAGYGT